MERFWILFLLPLIIVPTSIVGYTYLYDPFALKDSHIDEEGFTWIPNSSDSNLTTNTNFSRSVNKATETKQFFLKGDYAAVESDIDQARANAYTPWYIGSWMVFYFEKFQDDPKQTNSGPDLDRARNWVTNSPNSIYAHTYLGDLFYNLGWSARGNKFRKDTSENQFIEMKRYLDLAQAAYEKALEINPDNVYASRQLLKIFRSDCRVEKMKKTFDAAVSLTPDYFYLHKTYLSAMQSKWCGSPKRMFEFARQYSNDTRYPALSQLIGLAHHYRASQLARKKSILVDWFFKMKDPEANLYWTKYYRYFKNEKIWQEYSNAYEKVFRQYPNYADGLYTIARVARRSGRKETALKYYAQAIRADAAFLGADKLYWVAGHFKTEHHPAQANQYYRLFLEFAPENYDKEKIAYAADYVGWQYATESKYQESFPYYKIVSEISSDSARVIANYCNALFNIHAYKKAIKQCNRAINIDPGHAWSYKMLAEIYSRTGDQDKSSQYRQEYQLLN